MHEPSPTVLIRKSDQVTLKYDYFEFFAYKERTPTRLPRAPMGADTPNFYSPIVAEKNFNSRKILLAI
jgi:hypothetical protein